MAAEPARLSKGEQRRMDIVQVAAEILREQGPASVTHRKVAARAGASLSATTYYFTGLDDLLGQAAAVNFTRWVNRANGVAAEVTRKKPPTSIDNAVSAVLRACLPVDENLENHYLQLIAASSFPTVNREYRERRGSLDAAVGSVLAWMKCDLPADLIMSIVDGAAVQAISEGRNVRQTAAGLVKEVLVRSDALDRPQRS